MLAVPSSLLTLYHFGDMRNAGVGDWGMVCEGERRARLERERGEIDMFVSVEVCNAWTFGHEYVRVYAYVCVCARAYIHTYMHILPKITNNNKKGKTCQPHQRERERERERERSKTLAVVTAATHI